MQNEQLIPRRKKFLEIYFFGIFLISVLGFSGTPAIAQPQRLSKADTPRWLGKQASAADRKYFLMNGNQIVGNIYNYGGIAPGLGLLRHVNNMVWHGLGDIYQFCPLVAAAVKDSTGRVVDISSDAVNDVYAADVDPNNNSIIYGWEPLPDYADPTSPVMASSGALDINPHDGKPDSWPSSWYNQTKGQYVWPGYLRQDVPNADLEVLWGMDDRDNSEFAYFPFGRDTIGSDGRHLRGLGVKVEGRALQWSNALAQNTIFFIYTVQNYSTRDLDTVFFGMYGDVDVGGGYPIATAESQDDLGFFISPLDTVDRLTGKSVPVYSRSLVYFWDNDGIGNYGLRTHYDACKFLESPGNSVDGIDNDGDGMIDESQTNGIDDDHDWNPKNDDVGIDGVPDTHDEGEGDGVPTAGIRFADGTLDPLHPGEPNFELTDLDESDQIGLTAFRSWTWGTAGEELSVDSLVWQHLEEGFYNTIPQVTDISFLYGSGKIALQRSGTDGSIKRFSIALLMGENKDDIILTAQTVQVIYNQNYQFIRPPAKPVVRAVPGDRKVTLYWDSEAENSIDPIQGKDFEGYVIYRSTNPQFSDINLITDGKGTSLLSKPLTDVNGKEAKWDIKYRPEPFADSGTAGAVYDNTIKRWYKDLNSNGRWDSMTDDYWKGYSPLPYNDRGVAYYLGDNTGLVHSYVDSNNVMNGQTYYYAVVSYDHGDSVQYPPSECTKRISIDPITSRYTYDVNTVAVIPGPRASGYIPPGFASTEGADHVRGTATGSVKLQILDDMAIPDGAEYSIAFADFLDTDGKKTAALNYSVLRLDPVTSEVYLFDTNYVKIGRVNISVDSTFVVSDAQTNQIFAMNTDYIIDPSRGLLRKTGTGAMKNKTGPFTVTYRFFGQPPSTLLNNEEANPVFDGIKVFAQNQPLALDTINSTWINDNNRTLDYHVSLPAVGSPKLAPIDVEIFISSSDTSADGMYTNPGDTLLNTTNKPVVTPFHIVNVTNDSVRANIKITARILESNPLVVKSAKNGRWDIGEPIIFVTPSPYGSGTNTMYQVTFTAKDSLSRKFGGEIFKIVTQQPFTPGDVYQFKTVAAKFDAVKASGALDRIKVVPNPYVGVNNIEPADRLPGTTRGSRRIYFEHLPPRATIRIFTLSGELVRTLEHESGIDNGREYWDLLNRDNLGVAYGVYIAHIDAPGVGQRILKFAVIK
jgi:hypothetical protein